MKFENIIYDLTAVTVGFLMGVFVREFWMLMVGVWNWSN